ncbi:hypothetical protein HYC85_006336 [Camellia sinensis]|uniref:Amino acid transporter transmembrane domain-containing protein n=1 Tax=Camellia sinensis TaxID=4442 RepID=A0A7J7HKQ6_CAMSI|nr:hypothetical protein HYC85_006336 [Camellia sinensis]
MSQLGWIAGPLAMLLFASVTFVSAFSLCHCYRSPDPGPKRNPSYLEAVQTILGWRHINVKDEISFNAIRQVIYTKGVADFVVANSDLRKASESLKRVAAAILAAHD